MDQVRFIGLLDISLLNGCYLTIENFDTETLYSSRKIITDNGFSLYESRAYGSISIYLS